MARVKNLARRGFGVYHLCTCRKLLISCLYNLFNFQTLKILGTVTAQFGNTVKVLVPATENYFPLAL